MEEETWVERAVKQDLTLEQLEVITAEYYRQLSPDEVEKSELAARAQKVKELPLCVEGYKHFYWCIMRMELQPYAEKDWVPDFAAGKWTILECFRGSGKSTDMSEIYPAYCLLKESWTSALVVQANDDTANRTSAMIADFIQYFDGWKICAPNIVPDVSRGWGAKGYFIKDTTQDYGKWLESCFRDHTKDPSFVGAGIGSADIRGMHPRRIFMDDLHDINNSAFPKERKKIVDTVKANILPTLMKPATQKKSQICVACTPWSDDDSYIILYETGLFVRHVTPLYWPDPNGKYEIDGVKCSLAWEAGFPIENVLAMKSAYIKSKAEWAREFLCDREAAKNVLYAWYSYDADDIDKLSGPMVGGIDYASVFLPTQAEEGGRSHFAMCYLLRVQEGAIVTGGLLEQCSQLQAEGYVMAAQNTNPNWLYACVESDGTGGEFIQVLDRNPGIRIEPHPTREIYRGPKEVRQYQIIEPLLRKAIVRISDADTPYLNCLRSYLNNYPNISRHEPEWDVADSLVQAIVGMPELNTLIPVESNTTLFPKKKIESPLAALGNTGR